MMNPLFIISGASAVGKSSVAAEIIKTTSNIKKVITCTTRLPRHNEQNGEDYIFLSNSDFLKHVQAGDFLEYSEVYGQYYGTLKTSVTSIIETGNHALLINNWEGFLKIKQSYGDVVGIFLISPLAVLQERIKCRGDSEEEVARRMKMAREDMSHASEFDFVLNNDDIKKTASEIVRIIKECSAT
jgi:guanylate kinase